jgi:hypothetical protein
MGAMKMLKCVMLNRLHSGSTLDYLWLQPAALKRVTKRRILDSSSDEEDSASKKVYLAFLLKLCALLIICIGATPQARSYA